MNLSHEVRAAAQARQAERVLQLCDSEHRCGVQFGGEGWIETAQAVFELALRMRLPYGRHGAWAKHLQLLKLVCTLLEEGMAANGEQLSDPVAANLLQRARQLQGRGAA